MTSNSVWGYVACFCGWLISPILMIPLFLWLDRRGVIDRFLDRMKRTRER